MRKITSKHILSIIIFGATAILGIFAAKIVKSMTIETNRVAPNSVVKPQNSIALMQGPPQSLEEFVQKSEVIVIGRISRFTKEGFEGPYWSTDIQDNRNVPKIVLYPEIWTDWIMNIIQSRSTAHMKKRRTFTAEFKAERVLDALTGKFTPAEICREYLLQPQQLSEWKTEFITHAALVFQREAESELLAARVAELERHVGCLTLDLEASKKVSRLLPSALRRNGRS